MCVEWTRAMGRIDMSVANVFEDESERRSPASQEEVDKYMVVIPDCNDDDIFDDEPLTKRFRDDDSLNREVDTVSRRIRRCRRTPSSTCAVNHGGFWSGRQCVATSTAQR